MVELPILSVKSIAMREAVNLEVKRYAYICLRISKVLVDKTMYFQPLHYRDV